MKSLKITQTIFKIAKIAAEIAFVCCIVGFCFCGIGIIFYALGAEAIKIGGVTLKSFLQTEVEATDGYVYLSMIAGMVFTSTEAFLAKYALGYLKGEIADGSPFTFKGSSELFKHGIITIVVSIIEVVLVGIAKSIVVKTIGDVGSFSFSGATTVGTGILFLFLSVVFKSGAECIQSVRSTESKTLTTDNRQNEAV